MDNSVVTDLEEIEELDDNNVNGNKVETPDKPGRAEMKQMLVEKNSVPDSVPAKTGPSDYGTYKCSECGRLVMGFAKDGHSHPGRAVVWSRIGK